MNPAILNQAFQHPADGWYQIEALGRHPHPAAGLVQVVDPEAVEAVVKHFNADAAAGQLRHGNELLIDHEHFSDQADQETRAYGWLQELQPRADGIYGRIRWTKTGKEAVDGGDYRFFSTEYEPADLQPVNSAVGHRPSAMKAVRPLRLAGLTLTNMNNNRGQKPITNRGGASAAKTFAGSRESADSNKTMNKGKPMKSVCTLLGLSADADETAAQEAVSRLLIQLFNVFANRDLTKIDTNERLSGQPSPGNTIAASNDTAQENSIPGQPDQGLQVFTAPDGANAGVTNAIAHNPATGQTTVAQLDSGTGTQLAQSLVMTELTGNGAPGPGTLA